MINIKPYNYKNYIVKISSNLSENIETFSLPYDEYTFLYYTSVYKYAEIDDFVVELDHQIDNRSLIKDIVKAVELTAPNEVKKIYMEVEEEDGTITPLFDGFKDIIFRTFRIETKVFNSQMAPTLVELIRLDISSKSKR